MAGPDAPALPPNFPRDPFEPQFITQCRQRRHYGSEQIHTRHWTTDHWRGYLKTYYRFVEMVDVQVGRILNTLRHQRMEQDTLVVFTSDHGEGAAAHQWVVKLMLYEEPATVPLIWSWPGVIPAGRVDAGHLASGVDLLPTLCDYAGIDPPRDLAGASLRPVIDNPDLPGREFLVCELQPDNRDPDMLARMIRTRQHKYVAFSCGEDREMLFDLTSDPGETCNLAHLPDHQPPSPPTETCCASRSTTPPTASPCPPPDPPRNQPNPQGQPQARPARPRAWPGSPRNPPEPTPNSRNHIYLRCDFFGS
jgi:arylsulfatase A-like enzyme